jgi:hypothetical protein
LPTNELCNALNCYYRDGTLSKAVGGQCHRQMPQILGEYTDAMLGTTTSPTLTLQEQRWTLRRRVVRFLAYWQHILGVSRFHLDTVARSFIEVSSFVLHFLLFWFGALWFCW